MKKLINKTNLKEKGITLTALVVTIILLLILATITIKTITGDNGIIRKTSDAINTYKIAENKEQETLEYLYGELNQNAEITISLERLNDIIDKRIQGNIQNSKLEAWPVGSVYISTENVSPAELFGGTWESYGQGRTLVGAGTGTDSNSEIKVFEANSIGGEYSHKLSIEEMPSHNHTGIEYLTPSGSAPLSLDTGLGLNGLLINRSLSYDVGGPTVRTGEAGGSESHNNIQPYIVTYMWKRTA